MIAGHESTIKAVTISEEGYSNIMGKVLISPENGWEDYVMRKFEVESNGYSGNHKHDFPHIVFVIGGKGIMIMEGKEYPVEKGSYAYIPNNAQHQLLNTNSSGELLEFICIVPQEHHTFG